MSQAGKASNSGGGGGGGVINTIVLDSGSITGSAVTIYANNATLNSGSSVEFVATSGTIGQLNVTDASANTIIGQGSGNLTFVGSNNVGLGDLVLSNFLSGGNNVAIGHLSMNAATASSNNVAIGEGTLTAPLGNNNTIIGYQSGNGYTGSEGNNVLLNASGNVGESNCFHVGDNSGTGAKKINSTFICGINGYTVTPLNQQIVTIDSVTNQLGTVTSVPGSVTITGDNAQTASGANINLFALNGISNNCGSSVEFLGNNISTMQLQVTDASHNTFIGLVAGNESTTGLRNTSLGESSAAAIGSASDCVAIGYNALILNQDNNAQTAVGSLALAALNTGSSNTSNTAIGYNALNNLTAGFQNLGLGHAAGGNYTTTESNNICLHSSGVVLDSNTLRIGQATGTSPRNLNRAFICGIAGVTVATPQMVTINPSTNQLGVQSISNTWVDEAISFLAVVGDNYFCTSTLTATLPSSPAQGDEFTFYATSAGIVTLQAAATQVIQIGSSLSSVAGTATNTANGDNITLVYRAASRRWLEIASTGSWTLA